MERMGKMRYGWKKVFPLRSYYGLMFMCVCFLWVLSAGCRNQAVLYDSSGNKGDAAYTAVPQKGEVSVESDAESETNEVSELQKQILYVYVCGEVTNPGVYELQEGQRIIDAVEAAGGMTQQASATWLNLAEPLTDGQKIEVPSEEQAEIYRKEEQEAQSGLVNLNTASMEELMTLAGIGESKAQAILNYREEKGKFETPEELMEIPGIKEGVFQKIENQITVGP